MIGALYWLRMVKTTRTLETTLPWLLIIFGIIGLVAAYVITDEKFKLLVNPNYHPACSINPIISCGSVMQSKQAAVFGFPNPFIGLAAFPVLIATGAAMLAGAKLKRWYWLGLEAGAVFGLGFVHWLFFESVYRIHALCPYCMGVWVVTIGTFIYVTLYNLRTGHIKTPAKLRRTVGFIGRHHGDVYVLWLLVIAALILHHFWYYFGKNL